MTAEVIPAHLPRLFSGEFINGQMGRLSFCNCASMLAKSFSESRSLLCRRIEARSDYFGGFGEQHSFALAGAHSLYSDNLRRSANLEVEQDDSIPVVECPIIARQHCAHASNWICHRNSAGRK